jgi:hypothetical protein
MRRSSASVVVLLLLLFYFIPFVLKDGVADAAAQRGEYGRAVRQKWPLRCVLTLYLGEEGDLALIARERGQTSSVRVSRSASREWT